MKKLVNLKDTKNVCFSKLAGVSFYKEKIVGVNVELLWKETNSERKFIKLFSEYFTHEWLHLVIKGQGTDIGQEVVIRKLLGQTFSKKEKEYYAKFYK